MKELSPLAWFGTREVDQVPHHFIKTSTPMTDENYIWVVAKLIGRYAIATGIDNGISNLFVYIGYIYFEDPKEAMLFELRWSGK